MSQQGPSYKWLALALVSFGVFLGTMDAGMVNISLPRLSEAFGVSPATVLWVQALPLLVSSGLLLTVGRLGDLWGRKRFYIWGFTTFTMGLVLCSLSQNVYQLIGFRAVQAAGQAMITANSSAILTAVFSPQERGRAFGLMEGLVVGTGLGSGPLLGGFLLDLLGWQSIFYVRIPLALLGTLLAWRLLREDSTRGGEIKLDPAGAITSFLALAGLLLWLNQGVRVGWATPALLGLMGGVAACTLAFLAIESRVEAPVVDLALFRSRNFSLSIVAHILKFIAFATLYLLLPFYLMQGLGLSASKAGLLVALSPAVRMGVGPFSGWLSDKVGSRPLTATGLALTGIGLYLMAHLGPGPTLTQVLPPFLLASLGFAVFEPPNSSAIMGSVPRDRLGTGSAMVGIARQTGMTLGIATAGSLLASRQTAHAALLAGAGLDTSEVARQALVMGYQDTIMLGVFAAALGTMVALMTKGKGPRRETGESPGSGPP